MKKLLSAFLTMLLILSLILTGCGKNNTDAVDKKENNTGSANKTKVVFMAYNKEDVRKSWLEYLEKELPDIEIEFRFVDLKQFNNVLKTQLASGEGPDLMEGYGADLVSAGYLEDISNASFIDKYYDEGLKAYSYEGKTYAIPLQSWFEGIYYNKEIFEKYGLNPPKSWDQWMEIHETLKKNGVKPQVMGAKSWEPMMKQNMGLLLNEFYLTDAGKGFDDDFAAGKKTLSGTYNETMKKWSEIVEKGYITKDMLGMEYDQAQDEFATGKAAMWESGPWALETIKEKNPDLKFGMFPIPGIKEGTGALVGGPGSCISVNANSKVKDAAMKVLEATSTPEAQMALVKDNPGSSFLKGVEVDLGSEFSDCSQAFAEGRVYAPWMYWQAVNSIQQDFGKGLQDFIAGQTTIDDFLKDMDKKADQARSMVDKK